MKFIKTDAAAFSLFQDKQQGWQNLSRNSCGLGGNFRSMVNSILGLTYKTRAKIWPREELVVLQWPGLGEWPSTSFNQTAAEKHQPV